MTRRNEVLRVLTMVFAILGIIENLLLVPANFLCTGRAYAAEAQVQQTEEDKVMGDYENADFGNSVSREVPNPDGVIQNDAGEVQYIIQTEDKDTYRDVKAFVKEETGEKASPSPEQAQENQLCATLDQQAKVELENMDGVQIEEDFVMNGAQDSEDSQETQVLDEAIQSVVDDHWNIKAIHAEDAHGGSGQIKVAVLDSGADIMAKYPMAGFVNLVNPEENANGEDCTGHGTSVCSIIGQDSDEEGTRGVAGDEENVELYSVKVLDAYNQGPVSRVAEGIQWCIDHDIDIINMSFGTDNYSACLEDAVQKAADAGILMVASVGNGGENSKVQYPAAFSEVVGVGSVDEYMNPSVYNAQGKELELLAPGENVPVNSFWGFYTVSGGTSFAAPHVSAVAALLWSQHPEWNSNTVRKVLQESARSISSDRETGYGLLDYAYAEKIAKDVKASETATGAAVSGENRTKLKEYEIPAIVEANWSKDEQRNIEKVSDDNDHAYLIQRCQYFGWVNYPADELTVIKNAAVFPDNADYKDSNNKSPHKYKALNAGQYAKNRKTNYVAAANYFFESALRLYYDNTLTLSTLKEAAPACYLSGDLMEEEIAEDVLEIQQALEYTYNIDLPGNENIAMDLCRKRQLQMVGISIHISTDAFAHQGVIAPTDYNTVIHLIHLNNINDDSSDDINLTTTQKNTIQDNIQTKKYTGKDLSLDIGKFLKENAEAKNSKVNGDAIKKQKTHVAHRLFCDNPGFESDRYYWGAGWAVVRILQQYAGTPHDFDPYVFSPDLSNPGQEYPYAIYNLKKNSIVTGFDLKYYPIITDARWKTLSFYK